jgi:hypothetical protein
MSEEYKIKLETFKCKEGPFKIILTREIWIKDKVAYPSDNYKYVLFKGKHIMFSSYTQKNFSTDFTKEPAELLKRCIEDYNRHFLGRV